MTFGAHKLVCYEPFLVYRCEIWQLLPALCSDMWKNLYRCTSIFLALKYCSGFFLKISQLSIRSGVHKLFLQFLVFANFDRRFAKIVAPPGNGNGHSLVLQKGQSLLKKTMKTESKSTHINCGTIPF